MTGRDSILGRLSRIALLIVVAAPMLFADDGGRRGVDLLKKGDYEAALVALRDAQVENPDSPWLHFNIGLALYKLERWDEAATAFSSALTARDTDIEKRAELHLGNCAYQQGKLEQALEHYGRALELDETFEDARVNREFVTRKIKELARKKKDQQDEQEKQRKIIEKLQELIKKQTALHANVRRAMVASGVNIAPTAVTELAEALDFEMPEEEIEPPPAEELDKALDIIGEAQSGMVEELQGILAEARGKLEAAIAQQQAQQAQKQGGQAAPVAPPAGPPVDPAEAAKLQKALPFLSAAEPALVRARDGAIESANWAAVHAGQEEGLVQLLKALRELLDELSKIIQDQVQLLKDTAGTAALSMTPDESRKLEGEALLDRCMEHGETEDGLRERTNAFAQAVEQQLTAMREQASPDPSAPPAGPGVHPGQVPEEQLKRMEKALTHLNKGTVEMEEATARLQVPEVQTGLEAEKRALEELLKARAMLSPPQDQQDKNQKGDDGEKKDQQEKQDEDEGEQDEKKDGEKKDGQQDQQDQGGQGDENSEKSEEKKQTKMSEEQARKMLEQARQGERDRRREEREKARRAKGTRRGGVKKDW